MITTFNMQAMMSQENQVKQIPCDMLVPYHNHKFELYSGERLDDMVESIRQNGVLIPVIVQPCGENYEILSGHNRTNAAKIAGLETVPAVIKEHLTEDEAEMYMIETNLRQRGFDDLKISEQAAVLALRHSRMFTDEKLNMINEELKKLDGGASVSKLEAAGEEYGMKKDSVARLLRIDKLIPDIKPWVDSKQLAIRSAVEISYIPDKWQEKFYNLLKSEENPEIMTEKFDMKKASQLRKLYESEPDKDDTEIDDVIFQLFEKAPKVKKKDLKIKSDILLKYFNDDFDPKEVTEIIDKALDFYLNQNNKF